MALSLPRVPFIKSFVVASQVEGSDFGRIEIASGFGNFGSKSRGFAESENVICCSDVGDCGGIEEVCIVS